MSDAEQNLPFPPIDNPLLPVVHVDGKKLAATGSLVVARTSSAEIQVEDLRFVLAFDGAAESGVNYDIRDGKLHVIFPGEDAPLGASINPVQVATVNGRSLHLGVYHQTIGPYGRLVIYTLLTGAIDGK